MQQRSGPEERLSGLYGLCCVSSLSVSLLLLFPLFAVLLNCPYPDPPVSACFFPFSSAPQRGEGRPRGAFVAGRSQTITHLLPFNQSRIMRNENKSTNIFPFTPAFFSGSTSLTTSLPLPLEQCRGIGDGGCGQCVIRILCCSFLLTLFPCSSRGSHPLETVLHSLLQSGSFPWAAVFHELLQHRPFPHGAVLQEQVTPAWIPHSITSPASKPAPVWAPLSLQDHTSCQEPAPVRAFHRITASFGLHSPGLV